MENGSGFPWQNGFGEYVPPRESYAKIPYSAVPPSHPLLEEMERVHEWFVLELRQREQKIAEKLQLLQQKDDAIHELQRRAFRQNRQIHALESKLQNTESWLSSNLSSETTNALHYEGEDPLQLSATSQTNEMLPRSVSKTFNSCSESSETKTYSNAIVQPCPELFLFGGFSQSGLLYESVEKYDTEMKVWCKVSDLPSPCLYGHATAIKYDSMSFLFSALPMDLKHTNFVFTFNPRSENDSPWMRIESLLSVCLASYVKLGEAIYIIGGYEYGKQILFSRSPTHPFPSELHLMDTTPTVKIFDPHCQSWTTAKGKLQEARCRAVTISADENVIYSLGGLTLKNRKTLKPSQTVERYDSREGIWEPVACMNCPRVFFDAVALDVTSIMAMGGVCSEMNCSKADASANSNMEQFDARNNQWTIVGQMPHNRRSFTAHLWNENEIYLIGGMTCPSKQNSISRALGMDVYDQQNQWTQFDLRAGISGQRYAHASCLI